VAASMTIEWNGAKVAREIEKRIGRMLDAASLELQTIARHKASVPAARIRKRRKRKTNRGKKGSQYTEFVGSKPGNPPMRRTGLGQRSIVRGRQGLVARVGYSRNAMYMMFHELGIRYGRGLQRRPTLVPAATQGRARINAAARRAARK